MALDLLPFLGVTALVMAVPGPSVLYAVTQRLERGRTAGIVAVLGLETGLLVHVLAACLGLSALIAASPSLMTGLRYAGAAYLVVLGLRQLGLGPRRRPRLPVTSSSPTSPSLATPSLTDPALPPSAPTLPLCAPPSPPLTLARARAALLPPKETTGGRLWPVYRAGLLVDLLNPKTVVFFLALLPQFLTGGGLTTSAAGVMVIGVVGLALVFDSGYAALAGGLQRHGRGLGRWGPPVTGGCFLVLATATFLG